MPFPRTSGILLHPTSLPGPFGIGDLGAPAHRFVEWLAAARQRTWQVLPLGPTGYGDSPYQCFSAFAANPLLISPEFLAQQGLLSDGDVELPPFPADSVDYGAVIPWKYALLRKAYTNWAARGNDDGFNTFAAAEVAWLRDYALFMALKSQHEGAAWHTWPRELASRQPDALAQAAQELADEVRFQQFLQYLFSGQWNALKGYANSLGISIVGDIPIFVAHDSADVWSNPGLFDLDENGLPNLMAGVPPDYFSATGQLWGNPLYRWDVLAQRGYDWWIGRVAATLRLFDIVRIDHFRGFSGYWAVPQGEETAIRGEWLPGPGHALFAAIERALGHLPIIAEDLGVITPDVEKLRDDFNLPGMRIFQFAFTADTASQFLPHNFIPNSVAYTGTHDNDTTVGWFSSAGQEERARVLRYTGGEAGSVHWDMIRFVESSVANTVIVPLQDVLGLGAEARMNVPS
ncbi:MAG: 4-alpha-glucanotransferase, partial [Chloroflexales bacterium]|nr:4-alpha-glucanotransferase [Chloroflexales bacterium]